MSLHKNTSVCCRALLREPRTVECATSHRIFLASPSGVQGLAEQYRACAMPSVAAGKGSGFGLYIYIYIYIYLYSSKNQWCNQDFLFKTKTKTKTFLWCILEADRKKTFFSFGRKRKCRRKWNSIYCQKRNENEHSFSAEKRKESHLIILVFFPFHPFSHQVSPTMRRQYLVQFRIFAGGPCWRDSTFLM